MNYLKLILEISLRPHKGGFLRIMAVKILITQFLLMGCASGNPRPEVTPQADSARTTKVCVFNAMVIMMSGFTYIPELCEENDMTRREPDL